MNIIYMGTPDFAVPALEKIAKSENKVSLVISQADSRRGRGKKLHPTPVKKKALDLGLEVYQPENINSKESIDFISTYKPDLIVVAAYGQILSKEILELPKYDCINIHASILPKYRGAAPIHRAIIDGEKSTGISIMEMEEGLDTGDVLLQESIEIGEKDNVGILHDKLAELGAGLVLKSIEDIKNAKVKKKKQDDEKATYAEKVFRDTGLIDWSKDGKTIYNLVRGVTPWPGAYTLYKGKNLKIGQVELDKKEEGLELGEVFKVAESGIYVNATDSTVILKEIQLPGKKMMKVEDYLKGNSFEDKIILGDS